MFILKRYFSIACFKWFFFILFLSVPGICLSSGCPDVFTITENPSGKEVIKYIERYKGEYNLTGYDKQWEQRVYSFFKDWELEEAKNFLKYLSDRIGVKDTLKSLNHPRYFAKSGYKKFLELVLFYESYLGKDKVTERLRKSMGGFFILTSLEKLKKVVKYVEGYIGKEGVTKIMEGHLESLDLVLDIQLHIMEEIKDGNLRSLPLLNLKELEEAAEYFESVIETERKEAKGIMSRNFEIISRANLRELEKAVGDLKDVIEKETK